MEHNFKIGQRWASETQPEMGLGTVTTVKPGRVSLVFFKTGETVTYATRQAPLRRVIFEVGDSVRGEEQRPFLIEGVREEEGLLHYQGADGIDLCETDLAAALSFDKPEARLLSGNPDESGDFSLRYDALEHRYDIMRSEVRGFIGARMSLIPHQLYIAHEVARRFAPRVLLADEVGLGKTIEAGLIIHRLLLSNRIHRVLILLPESLVHQWFIEMLRRFNTSFAIFDEERCDAIEGASPGTNPFLDDQCVICNLEWLASSPKHLQFAADAGWDVLVVDEAHHLGWTPKKASPSYKAVETLSKTAPGLLLLTATPRQLGEDGHFARLKLLDPARYTSLEEFKEEAAHYAEVSKLVDVLLGKSKLTATARKKLAKHMDEADLAVLEGEPTDEDRARLSRHILDRHGVGRVLFRNRRESLSGFPGREANLVRLEAPKGKVTALKKAINAECAAMWPDPKTGEKPAEDAYDFSEDPRLPWLRDFIQADEERKIVLICSSRKKAEAVESALRELITVKTGVFHEGLTLIQRDRNAAWFADTDGAQLLICSEIGSEGRNFQFAHDLVLFDLPPDPELLEQRIGRLDRIGQSETIKVHIPFIEGTAQEVMATWFHEALGAIEHPLHGGRTYLEKFGPKLQRITTPAKAAADLNKETVEFKAKFDVELREGQDHLLELQSFEPKAAANLVHGVARNDEDPTLDTFMAHIFDHFGVAFEEAGDRTLVLKPDHLFDEEAFPGLPKEGLTATFDRDKALSREDISFLSWDHPMVRGSIDMLAGSSRGNASFVFWKEAQRELVLEMVFICECIAPPGLHVSRFLAPRPFRFFVNHAAEDRTDEAHQFHRALLKGRALDGKASWLRKNGATLRGMLPTIIDAGRKLADKSVVNYRRTAKKKMEALMTDELARLEDLKARGHAIRDEELELANSERELLGQAIATARVRLDSVRLWALGM
ncbi:MAG: RNA polymerase-associated protein RapA [Verrucomicrobiae bacterium]|nr:RNA polymerase-associated protein RapA [Verrucomicrobiae bacterium]